MKMKRHYTVKRFSDKQGFGGLSIMDGDVPIANMVMQLDDSELAKAQMICDALNSSGINTLGG